MEGATRFSGKTFRIFERHPVEGVTWKSGCFTEDWVGDWYLCMPVACAVVSATAPGIASDWTWA
jgi:hypothetical protein